MWNHGRPLIYLLSPPSARRLFPHIITSLGAKLSNLTFNQLEVVSRYSDPQLQMGYSYSYSFNFRPNIWKSLCSNIHLIPNNCDLTR